MGVDSIVEELSAKPPTPCSGRTKKKILLAEVAEIRDLLAALYGGVDPHDIPICDLCMWFPLFAADGAKQECHLVQHNGGMPRRGFCKIFLVDPEKDPRKGEIFLKLKRAHENPKEQLV